MYNRKQSSRIICQIENWLDDAVIGLQLCPFAKKPRIQGEIRFQLSHCNSEMGLLAELADECLLLLTQDSIETTLLIIPAFLQKFDDFNQFLEIADRLLLRMNWAGVFQVASFHPHFQFAGTRYDDRENWTNRAPYPILQLLRESSLTRAIDGFPAVSQIPARNIDRLNGLDDDTFDAIFKHKAKFNSIDR